MRPESTKTFVFAVFAPIESPEIEPARARSRALSFCARSPLRRWPPDRASGTPRPCRRYAAAAPIPEYLERRRWMGNRASLVGIHAGQRRHVVLLARREHSRTVAGSAYPSGTERSAVRRRAPRRPPTAWREAARSRALSSPRRSGRRRSPDPSSCVRRRSRRRCRRSRAGTVPSRAATRSGCERRPLPRTVRRSSPAPGRLRTRRCCRAPT